MGHHPARKGAAGVRRICSGETFPARQINRNWFGDGTQIVTN
jgi:hypothetical protein